MILALAKISYKHVEDWGKKLFGEAESVDNPFVFNNTRLWEKAISYLQTYIDDEVNEILQGRQLLVYTNNEDIPFRRIKDTDERTLNRIIKYLEKDFGQPLNAKDCAYITCKFYNDVEEAIIYEVAQIGIFGDENSKKFLQSFFLRNLKSVLVEGQEVNVQEIKEIYNTYTYKHIWKYNY